MPASIIIPAHNEANVIGRCLEQIFADARPDEFDVVVICNGCTDKTAEAARKFSRVRVIETPVASKPHALNLGDQATQKFPRFYVDADITISAQAIRDVAAVLKSGEALAAAPRMVVDVANRSFLLRAYYEVWTQLPYSREGMIGSGVYAVSKAGRERFGRFPDTFAEDLFVRLSFTPNERKTVENCEFHVAPPTSLASLVRIKTRVHLANLRLAREQPQLMRNEGEPHSGAMVKMLLRPSCWVGLFVYIGVKIAIRALSMWRRISGAAQVWDRDATSRAAPVTHSP